MGKQIKFELTGIGTTRKKNKSGVKETVQVYKYASQFADAAITVKGQFAATNLGFPTGDVGDTVLIEVGAKNTQDKLIDEVSSRSKQISKDLSTKNTSVTITAADRKLLRQGPTKGDLKDAPRVPGHRGRHRK